MNCIKCNAELKDGAKFCDSCGAPQASDAPQTQSAPPPCCCCAASAAPAANKGEKPFGVYALVLVLLGIVLPFVLNFLVFGVCGRMGFYPHPIIMRFLYFVFLLLKIVGAVLGIVAVSKKQWLGIAAIVLGGFALLRWLLFYPRF